MTEAEILAELNANDQKIIRALVEKASMGTDDSRLVEYNVRQSELREMLRVLKGQA